jgi:hypothetical protein
MANIQRNAGKHMAESNAIFRGCSVLFLAKRIAATT